MLSVGGFCVTVRPKRTSRCLLSHFRNMCPAPIHPARPPGLHSWIRTLLPLFPRRMPLDLYGNRTMESGTGGTLSVVQSMNLSNSSLNSHHWSLRSRALSPYASPAFSFDYIHRDEARGHSDSDLPKKLWLPVRHGLCSGKGTDQIFLVGAVANNSLCLITRIQESGRPTVTASCSSSLRKQESILRNAGLDRVRGDGVNPATGERFGIYNILIRF